MKLIPPNDWIIVQLESTEEKTEGGIIIGIKSGKEIVSPHDVLKGKVIGSGIECKHVLNDNIIFFEQAFSRTFNLNLGPGEYKLVREKDVAGVLQPDTVVEFANGSKIEMSSAESFERCRSITGKVIDER